MQELGNVITVFGILVTFVAYFGRHSGVRLAELQRTTGDDPYDVVLLDWKMRELDGFEVASELRAAQNFVPVLMLIPVRSARTEAGNSAARARRPVLRPAWASMP